MYNNFTYLTKYNYVYFYRLKFTVQQKHFILPDFKRISSKHIHARKNKMLFNSNYFVFGILDIEVKS